jgi:hypothetical protein
MVHSNGCDVTVNFLRLTYHSIKNSSLTVLLPILGWSGTESAITEATTGLLYQPRMVMSVEQAVECMTGETEVLRENLLQCRFDRHNPK